MSRSHVACLSVTRWCQSTKAACSRASFPDCRFVPLDSENHMPLADEPAWPRLLDEMQRFLAEPSIAPAAGRNALPLDKLTPRERAVLEGIAEGLDNSEIATSLELSEKNGSQPHHAGIR
jgi:hypothetical protein